MDIRGSGTRGATVTVSNADTSDFIGSDNVGRHGWHVEVRNPTSVPCRVFALQSDGQFAESDVRDAPSDCDAGGGGGGGGGNTPPVANANGPYSGIAGQPISFSSAGSNDPDGTTLSYVWDFGDGNSSTQANPSHAYSAAGGYTATLTVTDADGASDSQTATVTVSESQPVSDVSINSTSQNGVPGNPVPEQSFVNQSGYRVFAVNDLGMHCGDFDTRVSSILPPFNVMHATVIQRGAEPDVLSPADGVEVYYSAASNPDDPILSGINSAGSGPVYSSMVNGVVFKTNFWDVAREAYDPFYPPGILPAFYPAGPVEGILDLGLPMPNVEQLYLGDGALTADQQQMPGRFGPYVENAVERFEAYVVDQPFFIDMLGTLDRNFQFGYVVEGVNWYEAPGIPVTAFDDYGRENPWPLFRVQAKIGDTTLASVDTVVPISGEANCGACHNDVVDGGNGSATARLIDNGVTVATVLDDPQEGVLPLEVSKEYAADLNLVRLHDLKHGTDLENQTPVVCQQCHYTPALDLAQLGPLGPEFDPYGGFANGRDQIKVKSMSNVMHSHHGSVTDADGNKLFPDMPAAIKDEFGFVVNAQERRQVLEETCYQCHPGRRTDCLRGAMANGGMLCQDCHGDMTQVGNDFTREVNPDNPGAFELGGDFYTNAAQPRVPWANEPGCGSCHTGDAMSNLAGTSDTMTNEVDSNGNPDNIRLFQAYRTGDSKATPIVPDNKRFAENVIEADNPAVSGSDDPRIGNPMLYRVSTGHEGIFCEACHGSTHGIWPNKNDLANDNVAATQLQGHKGVISECSTCHEGDLGVTLGGPHGMHPVGNTRFSNGGHEDLAERNRDACRACHGRNGEGTVLSRAAVDRTLSNEGRTVQISQGEMVNCTHCHDNEL
ncbi:MAG: PKD domain-containing protein [Candidatus Thiodiazotropha sp.]